MRPIIDSAGAGRPLAAFLVPDAPQALAHARGRPACRASARRRPAPTPSRRRCRAARRASLTLRHRHGRARPGHRTCFGAGDIAKDVDRPGPSPGIDAGRVLRRACSTSSKPAHCSTASALRARRRSRSMPRSREAPALPFAYPVAVKVLSAEIAHKTDVGGVVLDVRMATRCSPRSARSARRSRSASRTRGSSACWCSR